MSEYQRFISYMYEYRNGKKSTNCGYARVENRNRLCRLEIHMKTSPQALEEPLRIYGCFHQDGRLFGVLLGQHAPVLDMVNWRYQGDPDSLNASRVPLSQLEGLILSDGSQIAYCSMWNDTVIDPNQMTPYIQEEPVSTDIPVARAEDAASPEEDAFRNGVPVDNTDTPNAPQISTADVSAALPTDTADISDASPTDTTDISDVPPTDTADISDVPPTDTADISAASPSQNEDLPDTAAAEFSGEAVPDTRPSITTPDSNPARESSPGNRSQADISKCDASENFFPGESAPADVSDTPPANEAFPADSSDNASACGQPAADGPAHTLPADTAPSDTIHAAPRSARSREPERSPADAALAFQQNQAEPAPNLSPSSSPWEQIQATYPQINPFTDDEIQNCVRVELSDLPTLRQNGWRIAGNRFILHSFQKNRHLVLGRLKSNGRYIFAVPGYYDNQERFMANMFGFPYFKSSDGGPLRYGQKGYWYRLLY